MNRKHLLIAAALATASLPAAAVLSDPGGAVSKPQSSRTAALAPAPGAPSVAPLVIGRPNGIARARLAD